MKAEINSDQAAKQNQTKIHKAAECISADLWDYIKAHEDELENLEDYARRRSSKRGVL